MLASITPLGERGRASRWALTVSAYLAASLTAGAALGTALGAVGSLPPAAPAPRLVGFAAAAGLGLLLDARVGGLRLPTVRRQVDEAWLSRYRGWVYGGGFGFQLGLGLVTIVTTSTVYLTFLLALLSGSPGAGGLLGAAYGGTRALPVLGFRRVLHPADLRAAHRRLQAAAPLAARATTAVLIAAAAGALVAAVLAGAG